MSTFTTVGALGSSSVLAHAIHLSDREVSRLVESRTRVAHCPSSNLYIASGVMPLARWLDAGLVVGLGSDVSGGPDLGMFPVMRAGAYAQNALRTLVGDVRPILDPLGWLRLGTLAGAQALGLDDRTGSLETGKEADLIVVDPSLTAPLREPDADPEGFAEDPSLLMSRLIFRPHPDMVRGAWVRGRRLEGPLS